MSKPIFLLIGLSCLVSVDAIALTGGVTTTCDVGEQDKVEGLCTDAKVSTKCSDYCKKEFGAELIAAQCTHERPNKKRECICRAKCCTQGGWGDPHWSTCDGTKFGYQGLKKFFVLKSEAKNPSFPYFEIRQINRPYGKGPMAVLAESELYIRDWDLTIQITTPTAANTASVLKVNDKPNNFPYRFSKFDDNRELFANVAYGDPAKKTQLVIKTSFGLKIVITTNFQGKLAFSSISIDTPRHPELKGTLGGILGGWDGNPKNDGQGPDGKKYPLDIKFSWKFGDSWIVPGGRTPTADCVQKEAEKEAQDVDDKADKAVKAEAEKLCNDVLARPEFKKCVAEIGRTPPAVNNCVTDLLFLDTASERKEYIEDLIESFEETCRRRNKKRGHRSSSSSDSGSSSSSGSSGSGEDKDGNKGPKKPRDPTKPKKPRDPTKQKKTADPAKPKQPKPAKPATPAKPQATPVKPQATPAKPQATPAKPAAPAPAPKPAPPPKKEEAVGLAF